MLFMRNVSINQFANRIKGIATILPITIPMAIDANSRARSFLRSGSSVQKNDIGLNVFNEFRVRVYKEKNNKKK